MTWVELYQVVRIPKFSRIPPACCPYLPACTARGGDLVWVVPAWSQGGFTCLVWGVPGLGGVPGWSWGCTCLVLGAYLPGPRGTCLVQGYLPGPVGCTWSGGGGTLPGPREGAPGPGGCTWSGGCSWSQGGTCLVPGRYLPRHSPL